MSPTVRHISIISLIGVIGFLGIFMGIIPDIVPDFVHCIPRFRKMGTGLAALNNFAPAKIGEKEMRIGTLNPGEGGHKKILGILESFDPFVRALNAAGPSNVKIKILGVQDNRLTWGGVPLFEGVWIEIIIGTHSTPKIVCLMPELKSNVRAVKSRFFSTIGFASAFLALLLEAIYGIFIAVSKPRNKQELKQCTSYDYQTCLNKKQDPK